MQRQRIPINVVTKMIAYSVFALIMSELREMPMASAEPQRTSKRAEQRHSWSDAKKGSWVVFRISTRKGNDTNVRFEKLVYDKEIDAGPQFDLYQSQENRFPKMPTGQRIAYAGVDPEHALKDKALKERGMSIKVVRVDMRELSVEKVRYKCKVVRYVMVHRKSGYKVAYVLWRNDRIQLPIRELQAAPGRAIVAPLSLGPRTLKGEIEFESDSEVRRASVQVVSLADFRRIGKESVKCIREKGAAITKVKGKDGKSSVFMKGTLRRWLSPRIPGHEVLSVKDGVSRGRRLRGRWEVVEYGRGSTR